MTTLEQRYRRLLAAYPRGHRAQHGEEMLGVLMASAADGRSKPSLRDSADLLWNAFRLHARRFVSAEGDVSPRSVLSIVSLLGPIAILAGATTSLHELAWWVRAWSVPPFEQLPDAPVWFVWLGVAILAVLGKRRAAAVGAWVGAAGLVVLVLLPMVSWEWRTFNAGWAVLGIATAVALTFSPGPAHGRELARPSAVTVMAATVGAHVALGVFSVFGGVGRDFFGDASRMAVFVIGVVVACGFSTRAGRRAAWVLAVPALSLLTAGLMWSIEFQLNAATEPLMLLGLPALVTVAAVTLPRLARRRGVA